MLINRRLFTRITRPFRLYGAFFAVLCLVVIIIPVKKIVSPGTGATQTIIKTVLPTPTPEVGPNESQKSFLTEVQNRWHTDSVPFVNPVAIADWVYDRERNSFIVIEEKIPSYYRGYQNGLSQIGEYTRSITGTVSYTHFALIDSGMYSVTQLLSYTPSTRTMSLLTSGGDGCGGSGSVRTLSPRGMTMVQKFGMGCVREPVHYIGDFGMHSIMTGTDVPRSLLHTVLLGNVEFNKETTDMDEPIFQTIFILDPMSGKKTVVLGKKDLPVHVTSISPDATNPTIIRISTKGNSLIREYDLVKRAYREQDLPKEVQ